MVIWLGYELYFIRYYTTVAGVATVLVMLRVFEIVRLAIYPDKTFGAGRSGHWPLVRGNFIKDHPECAVCGGENELEVHHIIPVFVDKTQELNPKNLITLCNPHHLLFGHLMKWKSFNKNVVKDAILWRERIENRP